MPQLAPTFTTTAADDFFGAGSSVQEAWDAMMLPPSPHADESLRANPTNGSDRAMPVIYTEAELAANFRAISELEQRARSNRAAAELHPPLPNYLRGESQPAAYTQVQVKTETDDSFVQESPEPAATSPEEPLMYTEHDMMADMEGYFDQAMPASYNPGSPEDSGAQQFAFYTGDYMMAGMEGYFDGAAPVLDFGNTTNLEETPELVSYSEDDMAADLDAYFSDAASEPATPEPISPPADPEVLAVMASFFEDATCGGWTQEQMIAEIQKRFGGDGN